MGNKIVDYSGKKALVLGLGRSGRSVVRYLHSCNAAVWACDIQSRQDFKEILEPLESLNPPVQFDFGPHRVEFLAGADLIIPSPSIPSNMPLLRDMSYQGASLITELDLALKEIDVPIVAFAGSHGKTTVAWLVKEMLESGGKKVFFAHDRGHSLSDYPLQPTKADVVLLELSSAQLERVQDLKPAIVVFPYLGLKQLQNYPTMEDYFRVQLRVLRHGGEHSTVIYNHRNVNLRAILQKVPGEKRSCIRKIPGGSGDNLGVNKGHPLDPSTSYRGTFLDTTKKIVWTDGKTREEFDLRYTTVVGNHNRDNLMTAINVVKEFGLDKKVIQSFLYTYKGMPHCLELVRKLGGVSFFNDSRSTTLDSLQKSLDGFRMEPVILIAGGKQREGDDFSTLADQIKKRVKTMILIGESKELINRGLGDHTETFLVGTFEEAILLSYQKSREGDVILLSPGCESYDMFNSYEQRGEHFKKYLDKI